MYARIVVWRRRETCLLIFGVEGLVLHRCPLGTPGVRSLIGVKGGGECQGVHLDYFAGWHRLVFLPGEQQKASWTVDLDQFYAEWM